MLIHDGPQRLKLLCSKFLLAVFSIETSHQVEWKPLLGQYVRVGNTCGLKSMPPPVRAMNHMSGLVVLYEYAWKSRMQSFYESRPLSCRHSRLCDRSYIIGCQVCRCRLHKLGIPRMVRMGCRLCQSRIHIPSPNGSRSDHGDPVFGHSRSNTSVSHSSIIMLVMPLLRLRMRCRVLKFWYSLPKKFGFFNLGE